jgi:Mg-chelatase subunit ChlI
MERAKRSLLLHAVDPRIGGTLLLGHRGCAKSTLARGFAALLPPVGPQAAPFVEVPLGVTEDRLLGSIQADTLLQSGQWTPQPGLLESAHNGVLYLDEINLLADPLADLLLDSAASGVHRLERDGLSLAREARYILVATMNPEEGDLRPQLADRFAHSVLVTDHFSPEERVEIGRRRLAFDDAPEAFLEDWTEPTEALQKTIAAARAGLLKIQTPEPLRLALAQKAAAAGLEGMRAELAILRTARASAALRHSPVVETGDIEEAWLFCLGHRQPPHSTSPPTPPQDRDSPNQPSSSKNAPGPGAAQPPAHPKNSAMSSSASTPLSLTPTDAFASPIPLRSFAQPRVLSLPQPVVRTNHLTAALSAKQRSTAHLATCRLEQGPIRWQASVVASLLSGWKPGGTEGVWRWVRSCARPARRLWALLDASRSTGAAQFLAEAREALVSLFEARQRIHLLLIHRGAILWLVRNATASAAVKSLAALPDAAGKSPLRAALLRLNRGLQAAHPSTKDTVCVCSDGLPTLTDGQSAAAVGRSLRAAVKRLAQNSPARALWLSPAPTRAFQRWLDTLLSGSGVAWVRLAGKPGPGFLPPCIPRRLVVG